MTNFSIVDHIIHHIPRRLLCSRCKNVTAESKKQIVKVHKSIFSLLIINSRCSIFSRSQFQIAWKIFRCSTWITSIQIFRKEIMFEWLIEDDGTKTVWTKWRVACADLWMAAVSKPVNWVNKLVKSNKENLQTSNSDGSCKLSFLCLCLCWYIEQSWRISWDLSGSRRNLGQPDHKRKFCRFSLLTQTLQSQHQRPTSHQN